MEDAVVRLELSRGGGGMVVVVSGESGVVEVAVIGGGIV